MTRLLLGLALLLVVMFAYERFTRPRWQDYLDPFAKDMEALSVTIGTAFIPAIQQATAAFEDFNRVYADTRAAMEPQS